MTAVAEVRQFNRFYTQKIGVLDESFLRSEFSLAEGRVLYELAHREQPTASEIRAALGIDRGYLSRILRAFARDGLVRKERASGDGRKDLLNLTRKGRAAFARINRASNQQIGTILHALSPDQKKRLLQ